MSKHSKDGFGLAVVVVAWTLFGAACAKESSSENAGSPVSEVPPATSTAGPGGRLQWTAPDGWVEERPSSSMRRAQFRVPGVEGDADAEAVVFYFGPGQGGDVEANVNRWLQQFTGADGGPSSDSSVRDLEVSGLGILRVETRGTYDGGMRMGAGPSGPFPGYMLLGAIAQGPDSNWFFKLTGPEGTVTANAEAFDAWIGSLAVSE